VREAPGATTPQIGAIAALALAAASTGVIVPALKLLVERTGHGATAGGLFTAAHVLGGALGAAYGARALRRIGSARTLAAAALGASIITTLAIAALDSLELRIALRFVDGACHLLAVTTVVAAAASGDPELRARRAITMGLAIVLGVASGILLGGQLAHPQLALVVAAVLSGGALIVVLVHLAPDAPAAQRAPSGERGPIAPGLLAFGERFLFGTMSVAMPFLAPPSRVSAVLGVFMTASVVALPLARRYAVTWGARRLAVLSAIALGLTLAVAGAIDVFSSMTRVLAWAPISGASAGALYAAALVLVARSPVLEERLRDMATLHAGGNAGFAAGALCAGALTSLLPGALVVAVPSVAILTASMIGVWFAVPPAPPGGAQPAT
jgi:MFS family permease